MEGKGRMGSTGMGDLVALVKVMAFTEQLPAGGVACMYIISNRSFSCLGRIKETLRVLKGWGVGWGA